MFTSNQTPPAIPRGKKVNGAPPHIQFDQSNTNTKTDTFNYNQDSLYLLCCSGKSGQKYQKALPSLLPLTSP